MGLKCFLVKPAFRANRSLRRYSTRDAPCSVGSYHNAHTPLAVVPITLDGDHWKMPAADEIPHDDPRWPAHCQCGHEFTEADAWQVFDDPIYVDDGGHEYSLRNLVPGMMWDEFWAPDWMKGPDGRSLQVVCPDGHTWSIDGQASNCTAPEDREHRCWTRTGEPPLISVGKAWGKTCSAGAGSIATPGYHGFLGINGAAPGEFT